MPEGKVTSHQDGGPQGPEPFASAAGREVMLRGSRCAYLLRTPHRAKGLSSDGKEGKTEGGEGGTCAPKLGNGLTPLAQRFHKD